MNQPGSSYVLLQMQREQMITTTKMLSVFLGEDSSEIEGESLVLFAHF